MCSQCVRTSEWGNLPEFRTDFQYVIDGRRVAKDPGSGRFDRGFRLVGTQIADKVTFLDGVAVFDEPGDDGDFING